MISSAQLLSIETQSVVHVGNIAGAKNLPPDFNLQTAIPDTTLTLAVRRANVTLK